MHGKAYDTKESVLSHIGQGKSYFGWNFARTETNRLLERDIVVYLVEIGDDLVENAFLNVFDS